MRPLAIVLLLAGAAQAQDEYATPAPTYTPPAAPAPAGQKRMGFTLESHIGTEVVTLTGVGNVGLISGGLFAGFKIDRFIVGLGFDLARVANTTSMTGAADMGMATTAFFFTPGIRVAIVRSRDQKVELFGQFDLGLGTVTNETNPSPMGPQPDTTRFRLFYNIGPGVRFWAHPQFSIGTVVGVHGNFAYDKTTDPNNTVFMSTSTTVTSIFAALQLMGVF
jgi:hypothetical protein